MILVIDHFDSFVQTLARYVREAGWATRIVRQDAVSIDEVRRDPPRGIILSPGPGRPIDAGISLPLVRALDGTIPILGVCLGHQIIAEAYGGRTRTTQALAHGKAAYVQHDGADIFRGLPTPMRVGRYHSLVVDELPDMLAVTARLCLRDGTAPSTQTETDMVMALRHRTQPVWGVQFHPESVLTPDGHQLIENFLAQIAGERPSGAAL